MGEIQKGVEKVKNKKKRMMPDTRTVQKVVRYTVYGAMAYAVLGATAGLNALNAQTETQPVKQEVKQEMQNFASSIGSQTFATDFAKEYFTWSIGKEEERSTRLAPYLLENVDPQAGLRFDGMEFNSAAASAQIWNIKETGKNEAEITVRVKQQLQKQGAADPKTKKAAVTDGGSSYKYLTVPITTDGEGFIVNDLPYFEKKPPKPVLKVEEEKVDPGITDIQKTKEIGSFLETFFKVYTNGEGSELSYYSEEDIQGVKDVLEYSKVDKFTVYNGKGDSYKVTADVIFKEKPSKATIVQHFNLIVEKKESRWIITALKNN